MTSESSTPLDDRPAAAERSTWPMQVAPGIWQLRVPLPFALRFLNAYALVDGDRWILVDTGIDAAGQAALDEQVAAIGLDWRRLALVVVTHFHPDHYGNAAAIQHRTGAPVAMAAAEAAIARRWCQDLDRMLAEYGAFFRRHGLSAGEVAAIEAVSREHWQDRQPAAVGVHLRTGWQLRWDHRTWHAITTPGHSPAHQCLFAPADGLLLAGDHILGTITPNVGASSWTVGDPLADFLCSLQRIAALPITRALPAHGNLIENVAARAHEIRDHHAARLANTVNALASGARTGAEVMRILFPRDLTPHELRFAAAETVAHLDHLVARGHVRRFEDDRQVWYEPASKITTDQSA